MAIINGSTGNDTFRGTEGTSAIDAWFGFAGDDIINTGSGQGADIVYGGAGNDRLFGEDAEEWLNGDDGNDHITVTGYLGRAFGGLGDDLIIGSALPELLYGGVGNDIIGSLGQGEAYGGAGNDRLYGGIGFETIYGDEGNDVLYTDGGGGEAYGGNGNGNDTLTGGTGADILSGGTGNDFYNFVGFGDVLIESNLGGTDLVFASTNWVLGDHFENLILAELSLIGGTGTGNGLANRLTGNSGANTLIGLGGNDVLIGGAGLDRMVGGADNDIYIVEQAGDVVVEALNGGLDRVDTGLSHALALNVEQLVLTGAAVINGTGNDLANRLTGNSAGNLLRGGGGNDTLLGAGGADQLWGEAGNDVLIGGVGADAFRFTLGRDVVADFANDVDTIQVDNALWGSTPRTIAQLLAMGDIVGTSAVFDFGGGHVLIVQGVSSLAILGNDLAIV